MRYFVGKIGDASEIVIYNFVMEFFLEKALLFLSEANWNVNDTAKKLDEWDWKTELTSILKDDMDYKEEHINKIQETGKLYFDQIKKVFDDEYHAKAELIRLELVSKENVEIISDLVKLTTKMLFVPCLWRFGSLSPAALYVTTILGYTIDLDVGITKGLYTTNLDLFNKLKDIWDNAVKELHTFQRGPTHQGTNAQILDNLYSLYCMYPTIQGNEGLDTIEKRAMMSVATALHDAGKGDLLADPPPAKDYHARNCATLILREGEIFKINDMDTSCAELIAKIVEMHNPEGQTGKISDLGKNPIKDNKFRISKQNVNTKNLCALFHLSDVMDTTRHRVSKPAFKVVGYLHPGNSGYYSIEKVVNARKGMIMRRVDRNSPHIEVQLSPVQELQVAAKARIDEENADLDKTGAKPVLDSQKWPKELKGT